MSSVILYCLDSKHTIFVSFSNCKNSIFSFLYHTIFGEVYMNSKQSAVGRGKAGCVGDSERHVCPVRGQSPVGNGCGAGSPKPLQGRNRMYLRVSRVSTRRSQLRPRSCKDV
jgi:hypothetical protein